jgi:hypothetical protein
MSAGWECTVCDAQAAAGDAEDPALVEVSREFHESMAGHETTDSTPSRAGTNE